MLGMWTTQTKAYDEGQAGTFTGVGWEGPYRFSLAGLHTWPRTEGFIQAMPRVRYYRLPFNVHQFDENGDIHPAYEDLITRLANAGYQFLWDLHDGPMQEPNNADRKSYWPTLYPDLNTEQDWHTFLQPNGTLTTNNLLPAWTKLLDWLDAHPTIDAQTYGFEFMNEPAGLQPAAKCPERLWLEPGRRL